MTMEKSCEKVPENGRRPIVKAVNDFLDELRKLEMPLHSVLVMQNDTLLAECYSQQYQEKRCASHVFGDEKLRCSGHRHAGGRRKNING